jgi:hypothetical protein
LSRPRLAAEDFVFISLSPGRPYLGVARPSVDRSRTRISTEVWFDLGQAGRPLKSDHYGESLIRMRGPSAGDRAMNYSIATADRVTHLKVVAVALLGAIVTMSVALAIA